MKKAAPSPALAADPTPRAVRLTFAELSELVSRPRTLVLDVSQNASKPMLVEFAIRGISSLDSAEIDKMDREAGLPPKKMVKRPKAGGGFIEDEEYDFDDAAFLARRAEVSERKRVLILELGVPDLKIPGETLDEKSANLRKALPPRIINALETAVLAETSDPVKVSSFT